jgi:hypothetical protein
MRIELQVLGLPPTKNEALSLFSPRHGYASEVHALLRAAQEAWPTANGLPFPSGSICLDVTVTSPGRPRSDATNLLGGIGDVLEDKSARANLDHLGDLATVALYANDRQIDELHFRFESGDTESYRIVLSKI